MRIEGPSDPKEGPARVPHCACDRSGSAAMTAGAANVVARRAERAVETQRRLEEGRAAAERAAAEQAAQAASLRAAGLPRMPEDGLVAAKNTHGCVP